MQIAVAEWFWRSDRWISGDEFNFIQAVLYWRNNDFGEILSLSEIQAFTAEL